MSATVVALATAAVVGVGIGAEVDPAADDGDPVATTAVPVDSELLTADSVRGASTR